MAHNSKRLPIRELIIFFILTAVLTLLLTASALIPKDAIKKNMAESADLLCEQEVFFDVIPKVKSSNIDRYADSILLGIAWQYDAADPLRSVMWSSYYNDPYKNENENLRRAVAEDLSPTKQYLRYWHGSIALVRPMLVLSSLGGIYIFNGALLLLLAVILFVMLIRRKWYIPAAGLFAGLIITSVWFVPLSLEYTWMYLLTLVFSIISIKMAESEGKDHFGEMFLIFGMITCFFDFLTAETMTLTVPLLLFLWASKKTDIVGTSLRSVISWGVGYGGFWCMKWLISSILLGENVMPYVSEHVAERLGGDVAGAGGLLEYVVGALTKNIGCLFPLEYGIVGVIAGGLVFVTWCYLIFVYRSENRDKKRIWVITAIGLIPYLRYIVLHNHSYLHYFFTYRAQLGTILAMAFLLHEFRIRDIIHKE